MSTLRELFSAFSLPLRRRRSVSEVPQQIYGGLVTQSRRPVFYMRYGVPDTVTGRFDLLCLHVFLLSHRLSTQAEPLARELSQEVFDAFIDDIDRALRELGIGDTTVPKRKKRLIRGFYAQIDEFSAPLDTGDAAGLAQRVGVRFFADAKSPAADLLADYMMRSHRALADLPLEALLAGRIAWPDPERVI